MRLHYRIILWLALLPINLMAYDFQAGHLFYRVVDLNDKLVEVTYEHPYRAKLYSRLRKVTIPSTVSYDSVQYTVIGIGKQAFHDCPKLRRMKLPETLLYIDSAACADMLSLDSLDLPTQLQRISDAAFYHCPSLNYIDIPATVDSIGRNVFTYCRMLRRITVARDNPYFDSRSNCNGICESATGRLFVTCARTTFPDDLHEIGEQAYAYSPYLRKALLPDSIHTIGYAAFVGCDVLDTLHLPKMLDSIGEWAFYGCQRLRHLTLPDSLHVIPYNCFAECNDLRELIVPESIDSLAERAFYFSGIRSANLKNVRYIGISCFSGCRFLKTLSLPASLEIIAPTAFENCNMLEKIYVPIGHRKRIQKMLPRQYHKLIIER